MDISETLAGLCLGNTATVKELCLSGGMRRRLQDIGLIKGARVTCLLRSPSGDPLAFYISGALIALRIEDASRVLIE